MWRIFSLPDYAFQIVAAGMAKESGAVAFIPLRQCEAVEPIGHHFLQRIPMIREGSRTRSRLTRMNVAQMLVATAMQMQKIDVMLKSG
jgi:hypothetical protein